MKNLVIVTPPVAEQVAVARFLDSVEAGLRVLNARVGTAISILCEYRTALISAAVTGKIDVRSEAA